MERVQRVVQITTLMDSRFRPSICSSMQWLQEQWLSPLAMVARTVVVNTSIGRRLEWLSHLAMVMSTSIGDRLKWLSHLAMVVNTSIGDRLEWLSYLAMVVNTSIGHIL